LGPVLIHQTPSILWISIHFFPFASPVCPRYPS